MRGPDHLSPFQGAAPTTCWLARQQGPGLQQRGGTQHIELSTLTASIEGSGWGLVQQGGPGEAVAKGTELAERQGAQRPGRARQVRTSKKAGRR